jgi:hypothetical protein
VVFPLVADQLRPSDVEHIEHESLSVVHHVMEEETFNVLVLLIAHEAIE